MGRQKGGRSKRDRKAKDVLSLKTKRHGGSGLEALGDEDLTRWAMGSPAMGAVAHAPCAEPGGAQRALPCPPARRLIDGSNALILPAKAERGGEDGGGGAEAAAPPEKQLSKAQQRKLRKIQEEKEKRERRADVMQTLAAHQVC